MRKYACNRLYYSSDKYLSPAVVDLDDTGCVISFALLENEQAATKWIGGIIVLSEDNDLRMKKDFHHFLLMSKTSREAIYAWHISDFDFDKENFSSNSILKRLY